MSSPCSLCVFRKTSRGVLYNLYFYQSHSFRIYHVTLSIKPFVYVPKETISSWPWVHDALLVWTWKGNQVHVYITLYLACHWWYLQVVWKLTYDFCSEVVLLWCQGAWVWNPALLLRVLWSWTTNLTSAILFFFFF